MIKKFYVDIDELYKYARFLSNSIATINKDIATFSRANLQYQSVLKDKVSVQVNVHVNQLKKIFANFSQELDRLTKKVKQDHALYMEYNSKLK